MDESLKDKILAAALPNVTFDGWNRLLLDNAAQNIGIDADTLHALFPKGTASLIAHFSDWADRKMLERLPPKKISKLKIREKITLGVRTRLEVLIPHKDALRQALGYYAAPWRKPLAAKSLWRTADCLWHAAGDTATDYNHYTKRTLLSGVLASTTLCFLSDASKGHNDTWDFLDRRIEQVLKIGAFIGKFKKAA